MLIYAIIICITISLASECSENGEAPFEGTIFIDSNIITSEDPSAFIELYYNGIDSRIMYDRRVEDWIKIKPFLFPAKYNDGLEIEIQVNPEFKNLEDAKAQAEKYGIVTVSYTHLTLPTKA